MIRNRACLDTTNPPGQIVNKAWPFPSNSNVAHVSAQEKTLVASIDEYKESESYRLGYEQGKIAMYDLLMKNTCAR